MIKITLQGFHEKKVFILNFEWEEMRIKMKSASVRVCIIYL